MIILVINSGSSSLKYQVIDMKDETLVSKGYYERIGQYNAFLTHEYGDNEVLVEVPAKNHDEALKVVIDQLIHKDYGIVKSLDEIVGVGHRVVHGGEIFTESVIITDEVIKAIEDVVDLAPLHNPAALIGIKACRELMPNTKMVAVFDTAFHQTIPEKAYMYAVPYKYYEKHKVRKYGFHGTSHMFVANRLAEVMNKDVKELKIVSCHLGQGASLCAIKNGESVDTSMGLTPLAGITMCSRSGDIDPSIVTFLMKKENLSIEEIENILNKESGVFGISGVSPDFRDIEAAELEGNKRAILALDMYAYNVAQYIAKYVVSMNGIDVITFTAGIGEKGPKTRTRILENLEFLGIKVNEEQNMSKIKEKEISTTDSKVKVFVIPTNEEVMIARDTLKLLN